MSKNTNCIFPFKCVIYIFQYFHAQKPWGEKYPKFNLKHLEHVEFHHKLDFHFDMPM